MRILLFLIVGLINFYMLAQNGMFQVGAFVLFLFVIILMAVERK